MSRFNIVTKNVPTPNDFARTALVILCIGGIIGASLISLIIWIVS
jgi:hypothetical protein